MEKMSRETFMPSLDKRGNLHTCFENCWRLPCLWWTVWEMSTRAVDRMGDYHTSLGQHGTLPCLLCTLWETSTPIVDGLGDLIVTSPSPSWCFTITIVDYSLSLCCLFTVKLLLHHLLPDCLLFHE